MFFIWKLCHFSFNQVSHMRFYFHFNIDDAMSKNLIHRKMSPDIFKLIKKKKIWFVKPTHNVLFQASSTQLTNNFLLIFFFFINFFLFFVYGNFPTNENLQNKSLTVSVYTLDKIWFWFQWRFFLQSINNVDRCWFCINSKL